MPSRRMDERIRYFVRHGHWPATYQMVGVSPISGRMLVVKSGFHKHRDAWNHLLDRRGELQARYGMELMVRRVKGSNHG